MSVERQIVVSGGAGFWSGADGRRLDDYILDLTGKAKPRVCYLATASGDPVEFIRGFYGAFEKRCEATHLQLFLPPFRPPADVLADQDVVYVSGGSTPNLLAVWRAHGIDRLLAEAWARGTILCGASAGGNCWFESAVTDSLSLDGSLRPFHGALGLLPGSHCPHYDSEPMRRPVYRELVAAGELPGGYATDDFAAMRFVGTELVETVASQPDAAAYRVEAGDGGVVEERLPVRLLGA